ncbi:MAG: YabP/YqfC family sporulation protein [Clostridia bacterium]|nr:YabP/YqfC family sporulation protein [Clostridia bacterium]
MNKRKQEKKIKEKTSLGYSLKDVFSSQSHIEISGNNIVTIEGSKGVLEYSDTVIRISVGYNSVAVCGRNLNLKCISPTSLIIEGFIQNIDFSL